MICIRQSYRFQYGSKYQGAKLGCSFGGKSDGYYGQRNAVFCGFYAGPVEQ